MQIRALTFMPTLLLQTLTRLLTQRWRKEEILRHIVSMSFGSLPIISISTAFAGILVSGEIAWHMNHALANTSMVPGITGQFILRELGIAIPALLLVSKVGASTTAEVGTMKITEQIDALRLLGIDPIGYLVAPRLIASILTTLSLTLIAVVITSVCAMIVAVAQYGFGVLEYLNHVRHFVSHTDLMCAVVKSATFGAVIPIVSCSYGFETGGGAEGVGDSTTQSVVTSTILVILFDFILTFFFSLIL